ncbi:hypothetical protein [Mangrovibacterium sp.]|uniref:hypothetical protein n=1 Tax=Mangrovibacterium sp. TaxID=1961364 RepID=UPI0035657D43
MSTKSIQKSTAQERSFETRNQLGRVDRSIESEDGNWKIFSSRKSHSYIVDWQIAGDHTPNYSSMRKLHGVEESGYSNFTTRS